MASGDRPAARSDSDGPAVNPGDARYGWFLYRCARWNCALTVREALPADVWQIVHVHVDTRRDTYAGILPDHVLLRMSTDREKVGWNGALLRDEEIFVSADLSDFIVGFGSCAPNRLAPAGWRWQGLNPLFRAKGQGMGGHCCRSCSQRLRAGAKLRTGQNNGSAGQLLVSY